MRSKVEKEDSKQQFREAEKKAYLASLEDYKSKKSLAEQFAEAREVPKKEREHFHLENAKRNMSHMDEMPGKGGIEKIVKDMEIFMEKKRGK